MQLTIGDKLTHVQFSDVKFSLLYLSEIIFRIIYSHTPTGSKIMFPLFVSNKISFRISNYVPIKYSVVSRRIPTAERLTTPHLIKIVL